MQKRKVKGMPIFECLVFVFFFLIKVLKDFSTNNKFVFTFMLFCFPSDCYQCISKLGKKISSSLTVLFYLALSDEKKK